MRAFVRVGFVAAAVGTALGAVSGCTSSPGLGSRTAAGAYQLVAFDSCQDALTGLRAAGRANVGPYGFGGSIIAADTGGIRRDATGAIPPAMPQAQANGAQANEAQASKAGPPAPVAEDFSGTNTHEAGVDEPDLVKTDGRRIVTVSGTTLRVVDAASRTLISTVDLAGAGNGFNAADTLLLSGDHALVLMNGGYGGRGPVPMSDIRRAPDPTPSDTVAMFGPHLLLVSLSGPPRVLSTVSMDGSLIDARQVGSTARVVIRSMPRMVFPYADNRGSDEQRLAANQDIIDRAPIEEWLPRVEVTNGATTRTTPVDCGAITRPTLYSGSNLVTVLTFDLSQATLGDGQPTTVVADGDMVYSNGPSLYVASSRWQGGKTVQSGQITTEIYRFNTSGARRPTFTAGGSVPGNLLSQYALSEWDGKLRVATTTPDPQGGPGASGVYVLAVNGPDLKRIGAVEGLGQGERIQAVRFIGPVGYVVTFRQTDPLFTVDLADPTRPAVRGELKIPGYSSYLHPAGDDRLIGIGQDATTQGRSTGTQVSLFDVGDLTTPARLAQYTVSGAHSVAEFDPHAFLFWPATGLLVVPLQNSYRMLAPDAIKASSRPDDGALVLRVTGSTITEVGFLQHPVPRLGDGFPASIRRSLVIGQTLWTVSDGGLMANDLSTLAKQAWIPLA